MKSVGDFYVNIIPKLDQIALNTGISAVNSSLELLQKGFALGKKAFNFFDDSARNIAEMGRFAKSVGQSIETVQALGYALKNTGLSAESSRGIIESLIDSYHKMKTWGEADWAKLSMYGIADFRTGNIIKDLTTLNAKLSKLSVGGQRDALNALGLPTDLTRLLGKPNEFQKNINEVMQYIIGNKQVEKTIEYVKQMDRVENIMNRFKVDFVATAMPAITDVVEKINTLLRDKEFIDAISSLASALITAVGVVAKGSGSVVKGINWIFTESREARIQRDKDIAERRAKEAPSSRDINISVTASPEFYVKIEDIKKETNKETIEKNNSGYYK